MTDPDPRPDLDRPDVLQYDAFLWWMEQARQELPEISDEVHWRSMARILQMVAGCPPIDWEELRADHKQVLRWAFTNAQERSERPNVGAQ